jgi:hypothetical protein
MRVPKSADAPVRVHSVQEEYFYLMVHPCDCGGPWQQTGQQVEPTSTGVLHRIATACHRCKKAGAFAFRLDAANTSKAPIRQVNPTLDPSLAIDAAEWLGLAQFYLGRIGRLKDGVEKAQSLLDARQCLEEALKFYGPGDDTPPASALWSEASRKKAAASAAAYRRTKLEEMIARIPPADQLRAADSMDQKTFVKGLKTRAKQRFWDRLKFWKKE